MITEKVQLFHINIFKISYQWLSGTDPVGGKTFQSIHDTILEILFNVLEVVFEKSKAF